MRGGRGKIATSKKLYRVQTLQGIFGQGYEVHMEGVQLSVRRGGGRGWNGRQIFFMGPAAEMRSSWMADKYSRKMCLTHKFLGVIFFMGYEENEAAGCSL